MTQFRLDINGLRALAVALVVLFHFKVPGFAGGYAGVDVFFVISGYLMFGILARALDKGQLSVWDFYKARFRRIAPALIAMVAALLLLGLVFLPAFDLGLLAKQSVSAVPFLSNFKFWREAGYFDVGSQFKWLLHTWSLSVEWQFYMLLPWLMLAVHRVTRASRRFAWNCLAIFIGSLLLCLLIADDKPSANFYLLPTRAWEMAAGGLAYHLASWRADQLAMRRWVARIALLAVVAFGLTLEEGQSWPNAWTLIPVLGCALVIWAGTGVEAFLDHPVCQWLGTRSYSIYLWHWPIFVAGGYLPEASPVWFPVAGVGASLLLGHLSHAWVEQRFLKSSASGGKPNLGWALGGALATLAACGAVIALHGVPGRLPASVDTVFSAALDKNPLREACHKQGTTRVPECTYGGPELGVIVLGDSHAAAIIRTVEKALPSPRLHVLDWTLSTCFTAFDIHASRRSDRDYRCADFLRHAYDKQKGLPRDVPLLIVNRAAVLMRGPNEGEGAPGFSGPRFHVGARVSTEYDEAHKQAAIAGLVETACAFQQHRQVYLLSPIPEMGRDVPRTVGRAMLAGRPDTVSVSLAQHLERTAEVRQAQAQAASRCGVKLLDATALLCPDGVCQGVRNGVPVYYDDDHLSERGAAVLAPLFRTMWP